MNIFLQDSKSRLTDRFFCFLDENSKMGFGLTCRDAKKKFRLLEVQCLAIFTKTIKKDFLLITDETGTQWKDAAIQFLGQGGSKKAWELQDNRALLIPQSIDLFKWESFVNGEVRIAKQISSLGLLTALPKKVRVSYPPGGPGSFPAYISISFEGLGLLNGWFIVDTKNAKSSTWKKGEHKFFKDPIDRKVLKNWDPVFDPLLTDIAKISAHGIVLPRDAINFAAVQLPENPGRKCNYSIRYFGNDFTGDESYQNVKFRKYSTLIPQERCESGLDYQADRLLTGAIDIFVSGEFAEASHPHGAIALQYKLQKRYAPVITARIEQIVKEEEDKTEQQMGKS